MTGMSGTLYSYSLPGYTMNSMSCIRVTASWGSNAGNSTTYTFSFGGISVNFANSTGNVIQSGQMVACNLGNTTSGQQATITSVAGANVEATGNVTTTSAVMVQLTFSVGTSETVTPEFWMVELAQ